MFVTGEGSTTRATPAGIWRRPLPSAQLPSPRTPVTSCTAHAEGGSPHVSRRLQRAAARTRAQQRYRSLRAFHDPARSQAPDGPEEVPRFLADLLGTGDASCLPAQQPFAPSVLLGRRKGRAPSPAQTLVPKGEGNSPTCPCTLGLL